MKVFHDGMPEWKKSGNLIVSSIQHLKEALDKDLSHVFVDVRPAEEVKKGYIGDAVSIPASEIAAAKDRFPADKKAPIVLYGSNTDSAVEAFKAVRGWGYANATVLEGGIEAWKQAAFPVTSGELKTTIVYVPKPRPGEILIEDFKRIVETLPPDKFILDVRDEDEAIQGMLKGAKNIPAQEIKGKLGEIPKDKEIIAHCTTGTRAEIAFHTLKEEGYKVRFLNATIKVDKDGKYEISKE